MSKKNVDSTTIENFLSGSNPKKYVIGIEANYNQPNVHLIINDPINGKTIEKHPYKPFLWFKDDLIPLLYDGKKVKALKSAERFGVKTKRLIVSDSDGNIPKRLANGYRYLVTCSKSYNDLVQFFKEGGVDIFDKKFSKMFFMFTPVEQFMIQTGIRLFKGMDDYNDLHRFQFDLETTGLSGKRDSIFQIGMRDNRGFEYVLETTGNTPQELRECERKNLILFFQTISTLKPDVITGYNSESFDWTFIVDRCERLSLPIDKIAVCLDGRSRFRRKPAMLKLGNEQEVFEQTYMFGYNIIDIAHAVRRAQAINSDIKKWNLKYITKYSEIAKKNRVYVKGDKIHTTWADTSKFAFNNENGDWYKISDRMPLQDSYEEVTGAYIVQRYLLDDLWETEQIDTIFNQASFLISKLLPTTYSRSSTMGTASQWKLIMAAWSYENDLAIPETEPKRDFTGGLSRLLEVGYSKNVVKLDYAALYPKNQLTHDIFPDLDISGVMEGLLTYIVDTRDKFKFLTGKEKVLVKELVKNLELGGYTKEEITKFKKDIKKHKALANLYDKKQLPLKILANSWFGAYGAPYIFNWGDTDCAEETTCRGRQYLRLMVRHFCEKHGFKALVGDSVTYDTPVYVKHPLGSMEILPICDLFNKQSEFLDKEGFRDYEKKPFQILTRNGWKDIKYIYRHDTDKIIHRITTKDRLINVTEDHSLFQDGKEVKPSELKRFDKIDTYEIPSYNYETLDNASLAFLYGFFLGDGSANCSERKQKYVSKKSGEININKGKRSDWKISNSRLDLLTRLQFILKNEMNIESIIKDHRISSGVYNLIVHNAMFSNMFCEQFYTSYREKKIPAFVLNANKKMKQAFIEGVCASDGYGDTIDTCSDIGMKSQVAMAGIGYLLKELGVEYKIKTRKDKENFISFSLKNNNRNNSSFTEKTQKKSDVVWKNETISNRDVEKFVYDVSTEDGTFICGIGGIIAHNTDGFNFAFPDNINDVKYIAKGTHWKTTEDAGKELIGLDAVLAEFNENYMTGRMGLDIDDICNSTINFSRKNYANDIGGKIKFVGNSIKSKKMPVYIEEFLDKAIRLLLNGDGKEFINFYYEYVDKIYNYNIPLVKIASKSMIRTSVSDYKVKVKKKNKAGNPMPRQAHMELVLKNNLNVNYGDTIYYVNTGTSKTQGDIKTIYGNKMTKKERKDFEINNGKEPSPDYFEIQLNCKLIDGDVVDSNLEVLGDLDSLNKMLLTLTDEDKIKEIKKQISEMEDGLLKDDYNVSKYLESFNKKVTPLLVCFHPDIRNDILLTIKKDKKTKLEKLTDRNYFTDEQCKLVSGMPNKSADQDDYYEDLMKMEDKEIKFWDKVNKVPNNMEEEEWVKIRNDYHIRKEEETIRGIQHDYDTLHDIFKHIELEELRTIERTFTLPTEILIVAGVDDDGNFISRRWGRIICPISDIFNYYDEAIEREKWYQSNSINNDDRYQLWIEYKTEQEFMILKTEEIDRVNKTFDNDIPKIKEKVIEMESALYLKPIIENPKAKDNDDEDEDEDEEYDQNKPESEIDGFISEIQKADFEIELRSQKDDNLITDIEIITDKDVETTTNTDYAKELLKNLSSSEKIESDEWNF